LHACIVKTKAKNPRKQKHRGSSGLGGVSYGCCQERLEKKKNSRIAIANAVTKTEIGVAGVTGETGGKRFKRVKTEHWETGGGRRPT